MRFIRDLAVCTVKILSEDLADLDVKHFDLHLRGKSIVGHIRERANRSDIELLYFHYTYKDESKLNTVSIRNTWRTKAGPVATLGCTRKDSAYLGNGL